jgi:phosphoribosylformylglycinamidine synthase
MAKAAVDEALRNLVAVGGGLSNVAILDNFCWGDSKDSIELAALVRASEGCREAAMAYQVPFISGKDSFNNTWRTPDGVLHSIPCTLLVSAIGIIENIRICVTSGIKSDGHLLYVVGKTGVETKGSLAAALWNDQQGALPDFNVEESKALYKRMQAAMKKNLIQACHDVSEGGIAVSATEMAFGGSNGIELTVPENIEDAAAYLFAETPSRFVVEVDPVNTYEFEQAFDSRTIQLIGKTVKKPTVVIKQGEKTLLQEATASLKKIWKEPLGHL